MDTDPIEAIIEGSKKEPHVVGGISAVKTKIKRKVGFKDNEILSGKSASSRR